MSIKTELDKLEANINSIADNLEQRGIIVIERTMKGLIDATRQLRTELKLTAAQDGSTIAYRISGSLPSIHIQTSTDGTTWTDWDGTAITLNSGEFRYIKNTANTLSNEQAYFRFVMTGKIAASGNINSMINFSSLTDHCFATLFFNCTSLTQAPLLPATTLDKYCYYCMFDSCTSLTQAPLLPATTLAYGCYFYMFYNCTSLTQAPLLPATTLAEQCYLNMFRYCKSLKVNENGTGTKIFTCPDMSGLSNPVGSMFDNTTGTFTGTPTTGNTYNWYE